MARHILIVDDNPTTVALEEALLSDAGHYVESAQSMRDAAHLIEQQRFDCLVTDLSMNQPTDGFVLVALFKLVNPNGTAVVNTGSADISANLYDFQRMIDAVLVKPAESGALLNVVEQPPSPTRQSGKKRLSDLLAENKDGILESWFKNVEADAALQRIPMEKRARLDEVAGIINAIISRIAEPAGTQAAVQTAQAVHGAARRLSGYSPTAILIEVMHLQNAINEHIQRNLICVNLGSLWDDILNINRAVESSMLELLHEAM
ncbi:MAG TPA: response regulator [Terriglobales bacterium]|nr:response regulator [Terriglobales bacterium]